MPYRQTGAFSKIVLDYIDQAAGLRPFFNHPPSLQGIRDAIEERKKFPFDRAALVGALRKQYDALTLHDKEAEHLEKLASPNTFTVVTAHQCNLFTGPLYVIYKILHAIRLSQPPEKIGLRFFQIARDAQAEGRIADARSEAQQDLPPPQLGPGELAEGLGLAEEFVDEGHRRGE